MTEWTHRVRNSLIDGERTYRLTPNALCWTETGRSDGRLAYADARSMQLISYVSPIGRALQCKVRGATGEKALLRSAHYRKLGNFEDRTDSYGPFARELAKRIYEANPKAAFIAGSTGLWLMWLTVGVIWIGAVALIAAALFEAMFDAPLLASFAVALGVCAICLSLIWREVRSGGSRPFDPLAPPEALLGRPATQPDLRLSSSGR